MSNNPNTQHSSKDRPATPEETADLAALRERVAATRPSTAYLPMHLQATTMKDWEALFTVVNVFSAEDWADILEVPSTCVWVVLSVTDRKVEDGSSMVIATISPEWETLFDDKDVICYIQTEQRAKDYKVELTITELVGLGLNLSTEIKSALQVLDTMRDERAFKAHAYTDRDMMPGGVNWTPKWNLKTIRQAALSPTTRGNLRSFGRAALDLSIEILPYARVFLAGVVFGRALEAGARAALEAKAGE